MQHAKHTYNVRDYMESVSALHTFRDNTTRILYVANYMCAHYVLPLIVVLCFFMYRPYPHPRKGASGLYAYCHT